MKARANPGLGPLIGSLTALLIGACLWAAGCSSTAGMFCQDQSDCRTGLQCVKPAHRDGGAADMGSFGVCEPARGGQGETCLYSSECQPPLMCSNELGIFTGDDRHGTCQFPGSSSPADAGAAADGAPADGPSADGAMDLDHADLRPADAAADGALGDAQ